MQLNQQKEQLELIASKLTVVSDRLGLIGNYLENISYEYKRGDAWAVDFSLFNRDGLQNLMNSLDDIQEQVQGHSNSLVDSGDELANVK